MNVIEFHTWNALSRAIEKPDRMTFDLDPGDGVGWTAMVAAARLTRALLDEIGLRSFVKTSGGKGLHVVVPLSPREGWDDVKDFSREVVERLATLAPDQCREERPKNRVADLLDYLRSRSRRDYRARARRGPAPVSGFRPVRLERADGLTRRPLTIANAPERSKRPPTRGPTTCAPAALGPRACPPPRRGAMTTAGWPPCSGISLGARA